VCFTSVTLVRRRGSATFELKTSSGVQLDCAVALSRATFDRAPDENLTGLACVFVISSGVVLHALRCASPRRSHGPTAGRPESAYVSFHNELKSRLKAYSKNGAQSSGYRRFLVAHGHTVAACPHGCCPLHRSQRYSCNQRTCAHVNHMRITKMCTREYPWEWRSLFDPPMRSRARFTDAVHVQCTR